MINSNLETGAIDSKLIKLLKNLLESDWIQGIEGKLSSQMKTRLNEVRSVLYLAVFYKKQFEGGFDWKRYYRSLNREYYIMIVTKAKIQFC